jgi:hypothetical protein
MRVRNTWTTPDVVDKTTYFPRIDKQKVFEVPPLSDTISTTVNIQNDQGYVNTASKYYSNIEKEYDIVYKAQVEGQYWQEYNFHYQGHIYFDTVTYYTDKTVPKWQIADRYGTKRDHYSLSQCKKSIIRIKARNLKYPYYKAIYPEFPTQKDIIVSNWRLIKKPDHYNKGSGILLQQFPTEDPAITITIGEGPKAVKYNIKAKRNFLPPNYTIRVRNTTKYVLRQGHPSKSKNKTILEICSTAADTPGFENQDLYDLDRRGEYENNEEYSESEESVDSIGDDSTSIETVETIQDSETSAVEIEENSAQYADSSESENTSESSE